MDVKQAVQIAIDYIADIFQSENLENIGLEEVTFDELRNMWLVTIGFSRPWDHPKVGLVTGFQPQHPKREYKTVEIDDFSCTVKSIKIREIKNA